MSGVLPEIPGVLSAEEVITSAKHLTRLQTPTGMIPWFPGGHCDPWNHVETAMALDVAGFPAEALAAYRWLANIQLPNGAWHNYYAADGSVEEAKLDTNVVAYLATGVWHHWLLTKDSGFVDAMWPVVERAVEFVLDLQTARGEILWARHADGTPWSFALLTGSSSICHSLRCAIALADHLGHERPRWDRAVTSLANVIRTEPDAFAPKHRWAMDWYYPVLTGVVTGEEGRARLAARRPAFVIEGRGVRCVSDRPWVTVAETCECLLAHLAVGDRATAETLFAWVQQYREADGRYWTGTVYPQEVHFPGGEQSTYTAASVVLAADGVAGSSPASALFVDHESLLAPLPGLATDRE